MGLQRVSSGSLLSLLLLLLTGSLSEAVKAPSASASTGLTLLLGNGQSQSPSQTASDILLGGTDRLSHAPREECKVKGLKTQERMNMAKLKAHRCLVRDTVVPVPLPKDIIVGFVQPTHVVVPRCTGKTLCTL